MEAAASESISLFSFCLCVYNNMFYNIVHGMLKQDWFKGAFRISSLRVSRFARQISCTGSFSHLCLHTRNTLYYNLLW